MLDIEKWFLFSTKHIYAGTQIYKNYEALPPVSVLTSCPIPNSFMYHRGFDFTGLYFEARVQRKKIVFDRHHLFRPTLLYLHTLIEQKSNTYWYSATQSSRPTYFKVSCWTALSRARTPLTSFRICWTLWIYPDSRFSSLSFKSPWGASMLSKALWNRFPCKNMSEKKIRGKRKNKNKASTKKQVT